MSTDLREELDTLARTQTFSPDPSLWERGRRARRRDGIVRGAALVAAVAVIAGTTAVAVRPEAVGPADDAVERGAIPSRIEDPGDLGLERDLAVGRASVAFVGSSSDVVVVGATDGHYHALALPEAPLSGPVRLSPDGRHLAYAYDAESRVSPGRVEAGVVLVDLVSGGAQRVPAVSGGGSPVAISNIGWSADSAFVAWSGRGVRVWTETRVEPERGGGTLGVVDVASGAQSTIRSRTGVVSADGDAVAVRVTRDDVMSFESRASGALQHRLREGLPGGDPVDAASTSPSGELTAVGTSGASRAVRFVNEEGGVLPRSLPRDLYPSGAQVTPLGWSADSLLLARVDGPTGSYAEGTHLALMSSPDRPRSEWTYRVVMRDVPDVAELSVAVDLVPDLDGTSAQPLTHDFGDVLAPDQRDVSWMIGLGVAAAIALLMGVRWLWRHFVT